MYLQTKAYKELFRNYIGGIIPPHTPDFSSVGRAYDCSS